MIVRSFANATPATADTGKASEKIIYFRSPRFSTKVELFACRAIIPKTFVMIGDREACYALKQNVFVVGLWEYSAFRTDVRITSVRKDL